MYDITTQNYNTMTADTSLHKTLYNFFTKHPSISDLWNIDTTRQNVTKALRNTESINIRTLDTVPLNSTKEYNNILNTCDAKILKLVPVFGLTYKWIFSYLNSISKNVEVGRIFFSKLKANCSIDEHTDKGSYFDYYDRFHFPIVTNDQNIFVIREEKIILEQGKLYWVNNHVPHYLENNSSVDRINLIFDAKIS